MMDEQQRLQKLLQGAFRGAPTPLKDIPTRWGESRKLRRPGTAKACKKAAGHSRKKRTG